MKKLSLINIAPFVNKIRWGSVSFVSVGLLPFIFSMFLFWGFSEKSFAQKYVIKGFVYDSISRQPLPYVNIYLKNYSNIGTVTDTNGRFIIRSNILTDSLCTQYMGYLPASRPLLSQRSQQITFYLQPTIINLSEITIKPGENPAFRILRSFWANRDKNNPDNFPAFQFESYVKAEIKIDRFTSLFSRKKNVADSAAANVSYTPFLLSETVSDVYHINSPNRFKEVIKAQKVTGTIIDDGKLLENYLGATFQNYNFYNNWLSIFEKNFASPLSEMGRLYYKYYLEDSLYIENKHVYMLRVRPKNDRDLAFSGKIWICDTSFALYKIDLQTSPKINMNFFKGMHISTQYEVFQQGGTLPLSTNLTLSLKGDKDSVSNMLCNFYQLNSNFVLNQVLSPDFYAKFIENADTARDASAEYWSSTHNLKNINEHDLSRSYEAIDSARNKTANKIIRNFLKIFLGGYAPAGMVDVGHWVTLYGSNPVEGNRFQIGVRTNTLFSKKWIFSGSVAYGDKDDVTKYSLQTEYFLNRKKWAKVGVQYKYDMERLGIDADYLQDYQFLNILFSLTSQFGSLNKLSLTNSFRCWFESDWGRNFNQKVEFTSKNFVPQGDFAFAYKDENNTVQPNYNISELSFTTRMAPNEIRMVKENVRVMPEQLKYPVFTFRYTLSFKDFFNSDFTYQKISLSARQFLLMGPLGKLRYQITGTKIFGTVPYSLLNIFQGNNSFMSSMRSYNMMNFSEFVADQSLELMAINDFQGIIFNRIPFLRKLKWRELAGVNAIWGSYSSANRELMAQNDLQNRPLTRFKVLETNTPYLELCYGVGNIFNCMRVIAFHRLTYIYDDTDKFGLRLSFYLSL